MLTQTRDAFGNKIDETKLASPNPAPSNSVPESSDPQSKRWKETYLRYSEGLKENAYTLLEKARHSNAYRKSHEFYMTRRAEALLGILIVIGLLASFYSMLIGGVIIGGVLGFCFTGSIVHCVKNLKTYVSFVGGFKSFLLACLLVVGLIVAPTLIIATALGTIITYTVKRKE